MKPDTFMPLFIGKWHQDTQDLDATATGAYFLLIMSHWGKAGISSDDFRLRQATRVHESDWARVKGTISQFFTEHDGLWTNKRCVEEYADAEQIYSKRVQQTASALESRGYPEKTTSNVTSNVVGDVTSGQEQKQKQSSTKKEETPLDLEGWLKKLEESPAYAGIDIRREFEKAKFWISEHRGRVFNHKFFLNWINKIDRPLNVALVRESGIPTLAEVKQYAKEKWGDQVDYLKWACSFHTYWNDSTRNWRRKNGNQIDWKIALTENVAKWRHP